MMDLKKTPLAAAKEAFAWARARIPKDAGLEIYSAWGERRVWQTRCPCRVKKGQHKDGL